MNKARSLCLTVLLSACLWSVVVAADDFVPKILPGGYAPVEIGTEVKAAANFAVGEQARREAVPLTLVSIASAEKQVVAGTNYRLLLTVDRGDSTRQAKVVVFRDLNSHYSSKSWEWL